MIRLYDRNTWEFMTEEQYCVGCELCDASKHEKGGNLSILYDMWCYEREKNKQKELII